MGTAKRRQVLRRSGARPGDAVYVSGDLGSARAGLLSLRRPAADAAPGGDDSTLTNAYLRPTPRVRLGVWLGRNRAATSCIDLSDGLSDGAYRMAEASGVGIAIDRDALPIAAAARALFVSCRRDPIQEAIAGGDDYELLFTAPARRTRNIAAAARHAGLTLTRIGECTDRAGVVLRQDGSESPLPRSGYDHFSG
jgi:thiamine-monophosphate kinase